jgi:acyl-CoA synthetase (NDP forming)
MREFWEVPKVFASQPLPKGNRFAIVSATGGGGVICIDEAVKAGLAPVTFTGSTVQKLVKFSPRMARNPVDMGPMLAVVANPFPLIEETILTVLSDVNVDCATLVLPGIPYIIDVFNRLRLHLAAISKPITVFLYGTELAGMEETLRQLAAMGIPTYLEPEIAVESLGISVAYSRIKMCAKW